jgi:hypothetical protein
MEWLKDIELFQIYTMPLLVQIEDSLEDIYHEYHT